MTLRWRTKISVRVKVVTSRNCKKTGTHTARTDPVLRSSQHAYVEIGYPGKYAKEAMQKAFNSKSKPE